MTASVDALSRARQSAIKMLTLREHSECELLQKLIAKSHDPLLAEKVVSELKAGNLVSDERFVKAFIRSKTERGYGPLRILQKLKRHEVRAELVDAAFDNNEVLWVKRAAEARRKRFGRQFPDDFKEWARQVRFLQTRGYTMEQIQSLKRFELEDDWN